jgi:peptide/nickel transport system substrate-binding protein
MRLWRDLGLIAAILLSIAAAGIGGSQAQDLRVALQDDPDSLDPAINQSFVGRHVLQSLCDKIVDLDAQGRIIPMLATSWSWSGDGMALSLTLRPGVTFHDGTAFDAEAVRFNLDRALSLPASRRKAEVEAIAGLEVTGPLAITIKLKRPSIPLLSALTDRAGMMVSPVAAKSSDMTAHPVCAGPYRFVERRAQERIVLARFPAHWRAASYHFDTVVFRPQPDSSIRLLNLRAGQFDIIERLAPSDVAATEADRSLRVVPVTGLGYYNMTFNLANGAGANPALTAEIRHAIDLAIDRNAINQVAFDGRYQAGNQPFPPGSPWYDETNKVRSADPAEAKRLMAGRKIRFTLMVPTDPERGQVAQMIQAMLAEIGITVEIQRLELISLLDRARQGQFEAHIVGWSGRPDPDLNITPMLTCGASLNDGHYCNAAFEALLTQARAMADPAARKLLYDRIIGMLQTDLPTLYLYHSKWIYAHRAGITGLSTVPDGILRLDGVKPI